MHDWLNQPAPFLAGPILFGIFLAVGGFIVIWRERVQERRRKEEQERHRHAKSA